MFSGESRQNTAGEIMKTMQMCLKTVMRVHELKCVKLHVCLIFEWKCRIFLELFYYCYHIIGVLSLSNKQLKKKSYLVRDVNSCAYNYNHHLLMIKDVGRCEKVKSLTETTVIKKNVYVCVGGGQETTEQF